MDPAQSLPIPADFPEELSEEQDVEEEARKIMEKVLANTLILKHILGFLRRGDLVFRTSFVSKYWNSLSREILREKYYLFASPPCHTTVRYNDGIKMYPPGLGSSPCDVLQQFNDSFKNSFSVPFRGLTIHVSERAGCPHNCVLRGSVSKLTTNILNKINIKFLNIGWNPESKCVMTRKYLKYIWESTSKSLEYLRITNINSFGRPVRNHDEPHSTFAEFFKIDPKAMWLPNLKRLDLTTYFMCGCANVIREFVQAAPLLQEFEGTVPSNGLRIIVEQDLAKYIQDFLYLPAGTHIKDGLTFAKKSPKLKRLFIATTFEPCYVQIKSGSPGVVNNIKLTLELLLRSSNTTLRYLEMSNIELLWLAEHYGFPELSGLTNLTLLFDRDEDLENCERLWQINWSKYFPRLQEFTADSRREFPIEDLDVYVNEIFWTQSSQFFCKSVTTLVIDSDDVHDKITVFKTLFPEVKVLRINYSPINISKEKRNDEYILWSGWENLEVLRTNDMLDSIDTVSSLLGISVDEANYLRDTIPILDSLEIVPSQLGPHNLKKLKIFSMDSYNKRKSKVEMFKPLILNKINVHIRKRPKENWGVEPLN